MNLNQSITVCPDVISQEVSGETVILDLNSENYFGLDEVGTRIWQLIEEKGNLQAIFDQLLTEYDVGEAQLLEDLEALLDQVADIGLMETLYRAQPKGKIRVYRVLYKDGLICTFQGIGDFLYDKGRNRGPGPNP